MKHSGGNMITFGYRLALLFAFTSSAAHAQSAGLTFEELVIEGEVQSQKL